jgi:RimJ/RimL family protein N-acetyltransferase
MTNFVPGRAVTTYRAKGGQEVVVRYPKWEDLDTMTDWINELSAEDTFINFSGEVLTREKEAGIIAEWFQEIEAEDKVHLCAFVGDHLASNCSVYRKTGKPRERHVADFGLSTRAAYRCQGLGGQLAKITIEEAKEHIPGLRLIKLEVFGNNPVAMNLYNKLGFRETGRTPGGILYRGQYVDDVTMVMEVE